jgi:hypothetical protein
MPVPYYGDLAEDATIYIPFNSFSSNDPSASVTITNLAAGDIHIHKNGSATQKTTANGITVSVDFDTITGNHLVTIDTSVNTGDIGFWVTGSEFSVRMEGTTIDGATINSWIGSFSIERAGGALASIKALNDLSAAQVNTEVDTALSDYDGPTKTEMDSAFAVTDGKIDVVDGNVDAILVDTGTTIPADLVAIDAKIDIIDTNVDAVLVDTGTTIPADLVTIDAIVDAILVDTGTTLPAEHVVLASEHSALSSEHTGLDGKLDTIDGIVDAILVDTGTTLPADLVAIDAKIDIIDAIVDLILVDTGTTLPAEHVVLDGKLDTIDTVVDGIQTDVTALENISTAQVNAEVLDVLNVDTFAEPGDEVPASTTTIQNRIAYLYKFLRNKVETTATKIHVYDDAGTNKDQTSTISDNGTTFTRGEFGAGA